MGFLAVTLLTWKVFLTGATPLAWKFLHSNRIMAVAREALTCQLDSSCICVCENQVGVVSRLIDAFMSANVEA